MVQDGAMSTANPSDARNGGAARIEAVEFKLAHLERAVQELSDVIYRQQQQLDAVLALHQRLRQQVEEIDDRSADASPVEIPPHY
jgi:uncharacterized coiled-coil protein SlyX